MDVEVLTEYRKVRESQHRRMNEGVGYWHPAACALNVARAEVALKQAEWDDEIRFEWMEDVYYEPSGDCGIEEEEREHLADGSWEALSCIVQIPKTCRHCGNRIDDEWEYGDASLGGIVVDVDDTFGYKREIERELASEQGVI